MPLPPKTTLAAGHLPEDVYGLWPTSPDRAGSVCRSECVKGALRPLGWPVSSPSAAGRASHPAALDSLSTRKPTTRCLRFSSSTVILEMTSSPARAPVDRPAPRLQRAVHSLALWMGWLSTGGRAAPKARRRRTVSTWGCKPEPPKIPAENVARDVSGHFGYPTRFSMQVLAVKVGRLWSGLISWYPLFRMPRNVLSSRPKSCGCLWPIRSVSHKPCCHRRKRLLPWNVRSPVAASYCVLNEQRRTGSRRLTPSTTAPSSTAIRSR